MSTATVKPHTQIDLLMVEDDEGDVLLTKKALAKGNACKSFNVAKDGIEALAFLRHEAPYTDAPRPDLILLDLNMPRLDGRETLAQIKQDENLRSIPVIVFSTSDSPRDIQQSYDLQASCYVTKPAELHQFTDVVRTIQEFWFRVAKLPRN